MDDNEIKKLAQQLKNALNEDGPQTLATCQLNPAGIPGNHCLGYGYCPPWTGCPNINDPVCYTHGNQCLGHDYCPPWRSCPNINNPICPIYGQQCISPNIHPSQKYGDYMMHGQRCTSPSVNKSGGSPMYGQCISPHLDPSQKAATGCSMYGQSCVSPNIHPSQKVNTGCYMYGQCISPHLDPSQKAATGCPMYGQNCVSPNINPSQKVGMTNAAGYYCVPHRDHINCPPFMQCIPVNHCLPHGQPICPLHDPVPDWTNVKQNCPFDPMFPDMKDKFNKLQEEYANNYQELMKEYQQKVAETNREMQNNQNMMVDMQSLQRLASLPEAEFKKITEVMNTLRKASEHNKPPENS